MSLKHLFVAVPAAFFILGNGAANAGQTMNEVGAIACVNDKWDESEPDKGHKLVDSLVDAYSSPTIPPHRSPRRIAWGSTSTCQIRAGRATGPALTPLKVETRPNHSWEEGSHLKEYTYKNTGGTGKYEGASGGGTYMYEGLTDTLFGGTYKGQLVLP